MKDDDAIALCPQGKLSMHLQETSAPQYVHLIFEKLDYVSWGRTGW